MRILLGVIAGLIVGFACIAGIEWIGTRLNPLPAGTDFTDPAALANVPVSALLVVLLAWFVGAFAGTLVALRIARHRLAGWAVPLVILLGVIANLMMIPHPVWMWVAGPAVPLIGALLAERVAPRDTKSAPLS